MSRLCWVARVWLLLAVAGCAKNGKLPYEEVVPVAVPSGDRVERTTLPTEVVAVLQDPSRPMEMKVTAGAVERTVDYAHFRDETWLRRPWAWKAEPKEHLQLAGYMALGGATLVLAGIIGEGDSDSKATAAGIGALALVGSPVPLVVLGVRKLRTHDTLKSTTERDQIRSMRDRFTPKALYTADLVLVVESGSGPGQEGALVVRDGAFVAAEGTVPYVDPAYRVEATPRSGVEIRWDLSDVGPSQVYEAHRRLLLAEPLTNPGFTLSYDAWKREAARRRQVEFERSLAAAVASCGASFATAWACSELLGERESTLGQVLQASFCDFVAAGVTGQDFGVSDAMESAVVSLVESRYPDYRKYLVQGAAFSVCVSGRMGD